LRAPGDRRSVVVLVGRAIQTFVRLVGHERPQLLAGLEDRDGTCGNFDRLTGAWIARHPGLPPSDLEGAETPHFDIVLLFEGTLDRVEEGIDDPSTVFLEMSGPEVRAIAAVTCSTRSALVMLPPVGSPDGQLPVGRGVHYRR
jgi:hypothetical protein